MNWATTQEEYDTTSVYEIVATMAARQCPTLSKNDVARWVENTVKPGMRPPPEEKAKEERKLLREEGIRDYREIKSTKIAFCGRKFQFSTATYDVQHGFERNPNVLPMVLIQ